MGNTKSKKVKFTPEDSISKSEETKERITAIPTESSNSAVSKSYSFDNKACSVSETQENVNIKDNADGAVEGEVIFKKC